MIEYGRAALWILLFISNVWDWGVGDYYVLKRMAEVRELRAVAKNTLEATFRGSKRFKNHVPWYIFNWLRVIHDLMMHEQQLLGLIASC